MTRSPTLAHHARVLALFTDSMVDAVHSKDPGVIAAVSRELRRMLPPHGFDQLDPLWVVLAAQIDRSVPVEQRIGWADLYAPGLIVAARGEAA